MLYICCVRKYWLPNTGTCSLTKAFTTAAMGILVEDGKTTWDTLVHDIMGEDFHFSDTALTQKISILDVLSHRMGLQRSNQMWHGSDNTLLLDKHDAIPHVQYLRAVEPFRSTMQYNNWGYALAGEILEKLSGDGWGTFVERNLLAPLKMNRTSTRKMENNQLAKPYCVLDDHSFQLLSPVSVEDGKLMGSGGGIQSTVNDMLKWCQALNIAYNDQQQTGVGHSSGSPIKQISKQMTDHIPFAKPFEGSAMGMGWARTQLPAVFSGLGCNAAFVKDLPTAGHGSKEVIFYHQGSMVGYTSMLFLIPRTESAIIVLSKSISLNDCTDWVGQTILEALLDVKEPNDYIKYAQESADAHIAKFPAMRVSLEASRIPHTQPKKLDAYAGRYYNEIRDFFIEITINHRLNSLQLAFQGLDSQVWAMEHYHHDSFLWLMTRDEAASRAKFTINPETLYKFDFQTDRHGVVDSLLWAHDSIGPAERFQREGNYANNF